MLLLDALLMFGDTLGALRRMNEAASFRARGGDGSSRWSGGWALCGTWLDEAAFVGEHDGLDAVA